MFAPFRRFERYIGAAPAQTWLGGGFAVRGLNTARGAQPRINWSKGQIRVSQARAAADWFDEQAKGCVRIVVCHHPLIEMLGGPMTARVWGGERAAAAFAAAKVDLVLSGHIHAPFTWPYPFGDGRTYAVGAGTLSIRERGVPAGFNVVEVDEGCFRVTALAWTGSRFEPYRTWALDRRPAEGSGPMPRPRTRCMTSETRNRTTKTKNRILAMAIDVPATVVKPSTPAISATTRKVRAQPSMTKTPIHSP